jgi:hypothetical protein
MYSKGEDPVPDAAGYRLQLGVDPELRHAGHQTIDSGLSPVLDRVGPRSREWDGWRRRLRRL